MTNAPRYAEAVPLTTEAVRRIHQPAVVPPIYR